MRSPFSCQGTISRSQFWLGVLAVLVATFLLSILSDLLGPAGTMGAILVFVLLFGLLWVFIALNAKRLRDAGLSPWLCLLWFVPLANLVVFLVVGFKPTAVQRPDATMRV